MKFILQNTNDSVYHETGVKVEIGSMYWTAWQDFVNKIEHKHPTLHYGWDFSENNELGLMSKKHFDDFWFWKNGGNPYQRWLDNLSTK